MKFNVYPVTGRRLAPNALSQFLQVPIPDLIACDDLLQSLVLADLDEAVWDLYPASHCLEMAQAIRGQIELLVHAHEQTLMSTPLPIVAGSKSLRDLGLSTRTYGSLIRSGYSPGANCWVRTTIGEILSIRNFGVASLLDLLTAIESWEIEPQNSQFRPESAVSANFKTIDVNPNVEQVVSIANALKDSFDVESVSASDVRFGMQFRKLTFTYQLGGLNLDEALRALLASVEMMESQTLKLLADDLLSFQSALSAAESLTLEGEFQELLSALTGERSRAIVSRRLGWDGRGGATLQEVADEFSISRERVRQICKNPIDTLQAGRIYAPALDRCLEYVDGRVPVTVCDLQNELLEQGFVRRSFNFDGLATAARVLGRSTQLHVTGVGNERFITSDSKTWTRTVDTLIRKMIGKYGVTTVDQIIDMAEQQLGFDVDPVAVTSFISNRTDFAWLDEPSAWFWINSVPEGWNRLINQMRKIFSIAPEISVGELRTGVSRHHRTGGVAPPSRVLLELCRQLNWCKVDGKVISVDPPIQASKVLGETEQILLRVLSKNGLVMSRSDLETECAKEGITRSTFYSYLTYSPIIVRHVRGVYGLRGASVAPGLIDSLRPRFRTRGVLQDFGWLRNQQLRIRYRVSHGTLNNGIVSIPASLSELLEGEYIISAADGAVTGKLTCRGNMGWGFGPVLRKLGAEPEDLLYLTLDPTQHRAIVALGGDGSWDDG